MSVVSASSDLNILIITAGNSRRYLSTASVSHLPSSVIIVYSVKSYYTYDILIETVNNAVSHGKLTALLKTLYVTSSSTRVKVTATIPPTVLSSIVETNRPTSSPSITTLYSSTKAEESGSIQSSNSSTGISLTV